MHGRPHRIMEGRKIDGRAVILPEGRTERLMHRRTGRRTDDARMDERTRGWNDGQTDGRTDLWMVGWAERRREARTERRLWADGRTHGWTNLRAARWKRGMWTDVSAERRIDGRKMGGILHRVCVVIQPAGARAVLCRGPNGLCKVKLISESLNKQIPKIMESSEVTLCFWMQMITLPFESVLFLR